MFKSKLSGLSVSMADHLSDPLAILLFPIVCVVWMVLGFSVDILTMILSVLAITMTQMILQAQNIETETNKLQTKALLKAMPGVPTSVAEADRLSPEQLQEVIEHD